MGMMGGSFQRPLFNAIEQDYESRELDTLLSSTPRMKKIILDEFKKDKLKSYQSLIKSFNIKYEGNSFSSKGSQLNNLKVALYSRFS